MITSLILPMAILLIGLAVLTWSSDKFIDGAAAVADHMRISPLIVGIIVLGFGTSTPEILVSSMASLDGAPDLAIGNVIGSNITNIALVAGATALIAPLSVNSSIIKREMPLLLAVTMGVWLLMVDGFLGQLDGIILLFILVGVLWYLIRSNRNPGVEDSFLSETQAEMSGSHQALTLRAAWFWVIGGLILLMLSAKAMVWGAVEIATFFAVPEAIIGLTIVAIGTSLPELASSIAAARKNEGDLVIGNILGSNLFNLLAVLAMPALIYPAAIDPQLAGIDYWIMALLTLVLIVFALWNRRSQQRQISRFEGGVLLAIFLGYLLMLYFRL